MGDNNGFKHISNIMDELIKVWLSNSETRDSMPTDVREFFENTLASHE